MTGPQYPGCLPPESTPLHAAVGGCRRATTVDRVLAGHWRAVLDYAELCTVTKESAIRLTGTAFMRLLTDNTTHPAAFPWRPRLLSMVSQISGEWACDERKYGLHPRLRASLTEAVPSENASGPPDRQLLAVAFRQLPDRAQRLLWHHEVEREPPDVLAKRVEPLFGEHLQVELQRHRAALRAECLQAHHRLAADKQCTRYTHLIDSLVRHPSLLPPPDLQCHLARCHHCRAAAEQFDHSADRLTLMLAQAVIGFRAGDYSRSCLSRLPLAAPPPSRPGPSPAPLRRRTAVVLLTLAAVAALIWLLVRTVST
ncbi:hypothetical protein [Streptomyces sp. HUAS TT20]|uniref:hypothetical protein n=1 Tax=Streptomyces sp. HUAS TT20 TaxID=3447509 RepID=UPI0021DB3638|nr:hypothetical protein [Streptomyces sp. HUAS 15-9]UXY32129.1 hypothetical protein N8I87_40085 [Streptomyces sp. HUAS 15-9]